MSKPEAWRKNAAAYPFSDTTATRYQDLDPHDHINNVAMAALFENGRVRFNRTLVIYKRDDQRWLTAAVNINYLEEAYFPAEITIASGIGEIGNRSWTVYSAAFQQGRCVATCDTVIVISGPEHSRLIDADLRTALEASKVERI
ncbi:MAG: thioesterase [Sphingomonas sanxanigenens]|uniref:Thioesterase n=1 Tax=Sphingomonas sanxanigenens TaxID=397260 RepID=A0A2W5A5I3_9SPHN|nr:MAG: thioesterase [Sphingomonas sanxanigenens]